MNIEYLLQKTGRVGRPQTIGIVPEETTSHPRRATFQIRQLVDLHWHGMPTATLPCMTRGTCTSKFRLTMRSEKHAGRFCIWREGTSTISPACVTTQQRVRHLTLDDVGKATRADLRHLTLGRDPLSARTSTAPAISFLTCAAGTTTSCPRCAPSRQPCTYPCRQQTPETGPTGHTFQPTSPFRSSSCSSA